jgi:4-hydroxybenzoate polyprenyltransferase
MMHIQNYFKLMRLDKPIGIFLLLWPTLIALMLATEGQPDLKIMFIFILGVVIMRSAGCVMNDIADRKYDSKVERTKNRPLAANVISVREAVYLTLVLLSIALALVLQLNVFTIQLSFLAVVLTLNYPLMKRFMSMPQAILGLAFGIGILMAFAATTDTVPPIAYVLYFANLCWVIAYDTQYAMVDKACDLKIGIKSTAIFFGKYNRIIISLLQIFSLLAFIYIGIYFELKWPYYLGIVIALALMIYQYYLIKDDDVQNCFKAFLNNHYVGMAIFLGLCLANILRSVTI